MDVKLDDVEILTGHKPPAYGIIKLPQKITQ